MADSSETIINAIESHRRILILSGAGISVPSGIPDFRSRHGLWSQIDPSLLSPSSLVSSLTKYARFWQAMAAIGRMTLNAQPNSIHRAVRLLQEHDRILGIVTQNIEGLHQKAGSRDVVELHGNGNMSFCLDCSAEIPTGAIIKDITNGVNAPLCPNCDGRVRPRVVLFGDALPMDDWHQAESWARSCDSCLVRGSGLEVLPAADLPVIAHSHGARIWILTKSPTPLDHLADLRHHQPLEKDFVSGIKKHFES